MSLATDVLRIVMRQVPWLVYAGCFRFRVTKHTSGRLDVEAVNKIAGLVIAPIPLRDVWAGVPGVRVQLTPGDEVILAFVDRDPAQAVIVGFAPLSQSKAVNVELDVTTHLDLGGGTKTVHREDDLANGGTFAAGIAPVTLIYTTPNGAVTSFTFAAGATPVTAVVAGISNPGKIIAKADPSTSKVRA